jgi:hypothetical protein
VLADNAERKQKTVLTETGDLPDPFRLTALSVKLRPSARLSPGKVPQLPSAATCEIAITEVVRVKPSLRIPFLRIEFSLSVAGRGSGAV